jgi:inositol oxygenase
MRDEYGRLDKTEMSIWECIELLNEFIDDSDPGLDMPQIDAEAIRKDHPDEDWLHLTGLIHGNNLLRAATESRAPYISFITLYKI